MPDNPLNFWQELKRRRVIRIIPVYAAAAFVLLELADIVSEPLGLPAWTINFLLVLLSIGLVISVILSWVYDFTPEGVQKTKPIGKLQDQTQTKVKTSRGWKMATYISIVIIFGLLFVNIFAIKKYSSGSIDIERSIAVLPFENWSYGENNAHLGDAIANEINTQLSKIKDFRVISYTSSSQYKASEKSPIPLIGKELGANFIIEGSVERQKEDVSIHVQFIYAPKDDHIWADEFKGKWEDIFKIRAQIAISIAEVLKTILSPDEIEEIQKNPTENGEAYDLYLKGRWFWNKWTDTDIRKGMTYFRQAINMDPNYAVAYAGLAEAYNTLSFYGQLHPEESYPKSKEFALKALEIDNTLSEAHVALAFVKVYYDWDWDGGEKEFLKAISLDPDNLTAHHLYAYFLVILTRYDEALQEINKALSLDPYNLITNRTLGDFYYHLRVYDKAEYQLIKTLEMDSTFNFTHAYLGLVYLQKSLCNNALEELQNEIDLDQGTGDLALAWKGCAYGICGNKEKGYNVIDTLLSRAKIRHIPPSYFSWIYFALEENDKGFEWLNRAFEERDPWLPDIKNNHFFDGIRYNPRYIKVLKKMELGE